MTLMQPVKARPKDITLWLAGTDTPEPALTYLNRYVRGHDRR